MSQHQSAHIPPPSDYAPRPTTQRSGNRVGGQRHDKNQRGSGQAGGGQYIKQTFQRAESSEAESSKTVPNKPQDRFFRNEDDDYFQCASEDENDVENDEKNCELASTSNNDQTGDDDEDDPLDAYMKSLEKSEPANPEAELTELKEEKNSDKTRPVSASTSLVDRGVRVDIDETDDVEESYYRYVEQTRIKKSVDTETNEDDERQDLVEYDHDGNIVSVRRSKKEIDPLAPVDHSTISYSAFEKDFYKQHGEIEKLTEQQSDELRAKLDIKVSGKSIPKPVCSFAHYNFDERLMRVIRRSDYTQPTPIQAQAIPAALMGRNIIGIAQTGSGKTAAYLWPMIVHIMGQPNLKRGDGPIGLVLVPTRELALQVYGQAKKFSSSYNIAVVCAYGGGSKYEQSKDLEAGAEIVVATPGRLIDLIKLNVTNLKRVTYLVLDEADRFFEMGFEIQVRSICDHIRPDRQTLLFSATFKKRIEQLARTVAEEPIKIVQKALGEVNEDVTQHVVTISDAPKKWDWLLDKLVEFTSSGSVLIFVTRILNSEELYKSLQDAGQDALLLHGDMEQSQRNRVITSFKKKEKDIMVATDVAARGLDIAHVRTVINYDVARDIDTHIHRIGRTGRAGTKGDAYTLITAKERDFAGSLVKNLESSNQEVSPELMKIAMQSHVFRKSRQQPQKHHSNSHPSQHQQPQQSLPYPHNQHNQHNQHQQPHHHHHPTPHHHHQQQQQQQQQYQSRQNYHTERPPYYQNRNYSHHHHQHNHQHNGFANKDYSNRAQDRNVQQAPRDGAQQWPGRQQEDHAHVSGYDNQKRPRWH